VREEKICQRLVTDLKGWSRFLFEVVGCLDENAPSGKAAAAAAAVSAPVSSGDVSAPDEDDDEAVWKLLPEGCDRRTFANYFKEIASYIYDEQMSDELLHQLTSQVRWLPCSLF
jgi:hypothetical protein